MILFLSFFVSFITIDLITLIKRKDKNNLIVFIVLSIIAIFLGFFYCSNTYKDSFTYILFKLFNIEV